MKVSEVFKTIWEVIKFIGLVILAGLGLSVVYKVVKAIQGKPFVSASFIRDTDPKYIRMVDQDNRIIRVKLPGKITNDKVDNAGFTEGGKVTIEVKHEKIDLSNFDFPTAGNLDI